MCMLNFDSGRISICSDRLLLEPRYGNNIRRVELQCKTLFLIVTVFQLRNRYGDCGAESIMKTR